MPALGSVLLARQGQCALPRCRRPRKPASATTGVRKVQPEHCLIGLRAHGLCQCLELAVMVSQSAPRGGKQQECPAAGRRIERRLERGLRR
jgi:hypothetical protein